MELVTVDRMNDKYIHVPTAVGGEALYIMDTRGTWRARVLERMEKGQYRVHNLKICQNDVHTPEFVWLNHQRLYLRDFVHQF